MVCYQIELWKLYLDNQGFSGDHEICFDLVNHELLVTLHLDFLLKHVKFYQVTYKKQIRHSDLKSVLTKLKHNCELAIAWFKINHLKLNTDNCHFLIKNEYMRAKLDQDTAWESNDVERLGITKDNNLRFGKHVSKFVFKREQKTKCHYKIS